MLGVIAAAWLVRDRNAPAALEWEKTALAAIYLVLYGTSVFLAVDRGLVERWNVPVFPLAAIGLFAIAGARANREMAAPVYCGKRISSRS